VLRSRSAFNIRHKYRTGCKLLTQMSIMYENIWKIYLRVGLFTDAEPIYECHQIDENRSVLQFHHDYNKICLLVINYYEIFKINSWVTRIVVKYNFHWISKIELRHCFKNNNCAITVLQPYIFFNIISAI